MGKPLYDGPATIRAVDFTDLGIEKYKREGLSEEQITESLEAHIKVEFPREDGTIDTQTITFQFSPREGKGNAAGKTQADMSMAQLERAGLIENGDVAMLAEKIGVEVRIWQKESPDGRFVNTNLGTGPQKIDSAEMARRLAKLNGVAKPLDAPATGGKPKPGADDEDEDPFS